MYQYMLFMRMYKTNILNECYEALWLRFYKISPERI